MTADRAGTTLLHYRILRAIGSGGMGVVYEADDTKLGRRVALKFLPPDLTGDGAALERFRREARAASALNHPNICTIYAIEEADGATFIAMERLEGESLDRRLAARPLPWHALVDTAVQIADALDAAHQRGIVHRDIKPANIFLTKDGRAKVLDFGVAKVTPGGGHAETTGAATASRPLTGEGQALGTIAYMSPEQARGEDLDARTDLFSLAAVLYEMSTGRRPFDGKTTAVIFQKILEGTPAGPREVNPSLPLKLEDVILRGLEKDPELRYQSAADLRADLKRLKRDATAGTLAFVPPPPSTGGHGPVSSAAVFAAEARRHKKTAGAAALALVALTAAAGYGIYAMLGGETPARSAAAGAAPQISVARLTASGDVRGCGSISPDGKYVVYCDFSGHLKVRQVATGSTVTIARHMGATTFSPDGNFVYLTSSSAEYPEGVLWAIPALGGEPRRVARNLWGAAGVSPDGQAVAFLRGNTTRGEVAIIVADAFGGGDERVVAVSAINESPFDGRGVSWSPDGRFISTTQAMIAGGYRVRPVVVDATTGAVQPLGATTWADLGRTAWLPGNRAVLFTARERHLGLYQFWIVQYPGGEATRITSDARGFGDVSVSVTADGATILTVLTDEVSNLWQTTADASGPLEQWTSGARLDGAHGIAPSLDGRVYYTSTEGAEVGIWRVDAAGAPARQLTRQYAELPSTPADGRFVVFQALHENHFRIWRMQPDGTDARALSRGDDDINPIVSPDGRWIYYLAVGSQPGLKRMASDGGEPATVSDVRYTPHAISPDSRFLLLRDADFQGFAVMDAGTGAITARLSLPRALWARWSPRADAIVYVTDSDGVDNLWEHPLAGGAARQVTAFTSGRIFNFAYSTDGTRLFLVRGQRTGDVILIRDFW
jgi:eukaryotic-like serine/threonine-protein kinase